jgi:alkylated DNA repair dioxygenase AlkB
MIYGKVCKENRLKAYFSADSKNYRYSGKESKSYGWPPLIQELVDKCQAMIPNTKFVRALINWYRDGSETVGKHRDKDGLKGCIASLSFYPRDSTTIERDFVITRDSDNALVLKQPLAQGSLFLMHEQMQELYQHALPPRKTIKAGRINVTLREAQE